MTPLRLWFVRGIVMLTATVLFTGFAEVLLRVVLPQDMSGSARVVGIRGLQLNRDGGTSQQQVGKRVVVYTFSEHHLRGTHKEISDQPILFLGDSFTFGWLLDEPDTYVSLMQEQARREQPINPPQFLNGGVGGWGTSDYVAFFEEYGTKIAPAKLVVFLNFDDIRRSAVSSLYKLSEDGSTVIPGSNSPKFYGLKRILNRVPLYHWAIQNLHVVQLFRGIYIRKLVSNQATAESERIHHAPAPERKRDSVDLGRALFLRLKMLCAERDVELVVVTTGFRKTICNDHGMVCAEEDLAFAEQAAEFFAEQGIPYFDITEPVAAEIGTAAADFLIPEDHHPNERGAALIAKHAWTALRSHLLDNVTGH